MKYTNGIKMSIVDKDNSPANYATTGYYYQIDPKKLTFIEWKDKALELDPEVDMTFWEFDINFSKDLIDKYKDSTEEVEFTQKKYIITNRRLVHVFNNDKYYHASGFHTAPKNVTDFLKGLFLPDSVRFSKGRGPDSYELKNKETKTKSYLNIQDNKYLKIQTSYYAKNIGIIESLDYTFTDDFDMIDASVPLNEAYLAPLQEKYLLVEKFLYTYNPNVVALGNSVIGYDGVMSISLDEEQIPLILKNYEFIQEEVGCHFLIEDNNLTLMLK